MNELRKKRVGFVRPEEGETKPIWDRIRRQKGGLRHKRSQNEPNLPDRMSSKCGVTVTLDRLRDCVYSSVVAEMAGRSF